MSLIILKFPRKVSGKVLSQVYDNSSKVQINKWSTQYIKIHGRCPVTKCFVIHDTHIVTHICEYHCVAWWL